MRLYLFILPFILFSCTKKTVFKPDEPVVGLDAQILKNIAYEKDKFQKMDIYLPANRSTASTKVMILIHGGFWIEGDKDDNDAAPMVDSIRKRLPDWAVFNLNYRLAPFNKFPDQENDINLAIKYIFDRKDKFVISDKWVFAGVDAGAHLAMLQGYKYNQPIKPKAIINFFGPGDLVELCNVDAETAYFLSLILNGTPQENPNLYSSSSPINYINAQSPPTIILQGELDDTSPKEQAFALRDKLQSFNVKNQLILYPNEYHGWSSEATLVDSFDKVMAFLKSNVP